MSEIFGKSKVDQVNEQFVPEHEALAKETEEKLTPEARIKLYQSMTSFGLKFEQKLPYNKFLVDQVNKLYKSFPESAKLEKFREALIDRERKKLEQ